MAIKDQVIKIKNSMVAYPNVKIVAAVKYFNIDETRIIAESGILDLGENRKDVFLAKREALKDLPITWHYFGVIKIPPRLQPEFIDNIDYLHSLDSLDLANAINKARTKEEPLKCFVYVNISGQANKAGLEETKVIPFIKSLKKFPKIEVIGLMTTGVNSFDDEILDDAFDRMKELRDEVQALNLPYAPCKELSMGMSNDYLIAVKHEATMVRIGQAFISED